jgi:hypothetical protein
LRILSPEPVPWDIGGKLFMQSPLRIDQLGDVMEEIVDIVVGGGRGAILDQIVDAAAGEKGAKGASIPPSTMPILIRTLVGVPKRLPKVVSLCLPGAKEQHLRDHLNARQAVAIIKTFIEQNEIGALIQDFFGLMTSVNLSVQQATEEIQAETGEEPESEEETTEEASEQP